MKRNIFLFIFVTLIAFIALVGCKTEATNRPVEVVNHTVTFIVDGAQYGEKVTVEDGKAVAKPADPVKAEDDANTYEFKFWHLAGESAAYDFSKPIKEDTKIYAIFEATAKPYDFIAYIWQGDQENIYITDLEAAQIKATIEGAEALAGKRVLVYTVKGKTRNAFVSEVNANGLVDLAFGGANLSAKDKVEGVEYLDIDTTESENDGHLVKIAAGWVANGSRYLGVLNTSTHKADALAVYSIFTAQGPDYATLDHTSATLKSTESLQVTVADTEKEVVWSSTNEEVATVQNGLI
ncbi:MAG: InlB B-repeat-containing protein, partial [Bacilli bacterium]|nr:InlB B-repeat-containing protein [Bacilli bacterium]